MKRISRGFEFRCPECGGSHFGSRSGALEGSSDTCIRVCHDQYGRGCRWSGPDFWELWIWVEHFTPENAEDYEKLRLAERDAANGTRKFPAKNFGPLNGIEDLLEVPK